MYITFEHCHFSLVIPIFASLFGVLSLVKWYI